MDATHSPVIDYPSAADHGGDLPPQFDRARACGPLGRVRLPDGRTAWLVTRHDDVRTVLADERFIRDTTGGGAGRTVNTAGRPHAELRAVVAKAFGGRQIGDWATRIRELADDLLDAVERHGPPADLVALVAAPLPAIVICELLGVPADDHPRLTAWCDRITAVPGSDQAAWRELAGYVAAAARAKRGRPGADVLTHLVGAHDDGALTHEELVQLGLLILAGGMETTRTAIAAGLLRLLRAPEQLRRLRADPALIDPAVEEILRYQPVVDLNRVQLATEDVLLGEHLVRAGELVQISINAANRDDRVFPDASRFAVDRTPNPHLAFGHGAHHCLGAALARLELRTVLAAVIGRFPRLASAVPPDRLRWRGGHITLGLDELPVTW